MVCSEDVRPYANFEIHKEFIRKCDCLFSLIAQFCTTIPMVGQLFVNNMRLTYTSIDE